MAHNNPVIDSGIVEAYPADDPRRRGSNPAPSQASENVSSGYGQQGGERLHHGHGYGHEQPVHQENVHQSQGHPGTAPLQDPTQTYDQSTGTAPLQPSSHQVPSHTEPAPPLPPRDGHPIPSTQPGVDNHVHNNQHVAQETPPGQDPFNVTPSHQPGTSTETGTGTGTGTENLVGGLDGRYHKVDAPAPYSHGGTNTANLAHLRRGDYSSGGTHAPVQHNTGTLAGAHEPAAGIGTNTHEPAAGTTTSTGTAPGTDTRTKGEILKESASGVKGLAAAVHGAGETVRGTFNSQVDRAFRDKAGTAKNEAIARDGRTEIQDGQFVHAKNPVGGVKGSNPVERREYQAFEAER